jgi:SAM-dependent methyltransferase
MRNVRCFDDSILPMYYALRRLGYKVEIRRDSMNPASLNICYGSNYDPLGQWTPLPANSVIVNLEQLTSPGYPWLKNEAYFELLSRHEVWDFSRQNIEYLAGRGLVAAFLPQGYVPEMTRLKPGAIENQDVLFYGALTPRRRAVLAELTAKGVRVNCLTRAYGARRDQAIYTAKLFLNIHHSVPASLEVVRLGYILANSRAVVSELNPDTYHYPELAGACAFSPYDGLAETTLELLKDADRRGRQARQGFEAFSALDLCGALEKLLGRRAARGLGADFAPATPTRPLGDFAEPRPDLINAGSGADFRNEALNIDVDPRFSPDLVLDLALPLDMSATHETARFGEIRLRPGSFSRIVCFGLLGLVADRAVFMRNMLALLAEGGEMLLSVPYDLSLEAAGAGSFNEGSWKNEAGENRLLEGEGARFEVERLDYVLSDFGRARQAGGASPETLRVTPRAISEMHVLLRKRALTDDDRARRLALTRECYDRPVIDWEIREQEADEARRGQPRLPGRLGLGWRLLRLRLRRCRYRFNAKHAKDAGRYQDKLKELDLEIESVRRLAAHFKA